MPIGVSPHAVQNHNYHRVNDNTSPSKTASSLDRVSNTPIEIEMPLMRISRNEGTRNVSELSTNYNAESSIKSKLITCAKAAGVVAGVGLLIGIGAGIRHVFGSGTTSSGAIRENSFTNSPRGERLIGLVDLPGKISILESWFVRENNVAAASNITRESIKEFFIKLEVEGIGGHEVARDSEIQTKFPEIFNAIEQGRKDAIVNLKSFRDKCIANCDFPLLPVSEGGSGPYLKGLIGWMLEQSNNLTRSELSIATDTIYTNLLSEMNVSQDEFESRESYIGSRALIDFLIELAENPCHANNLSRQCLQYVLMEQNEAGLEKDKAENRPLTYASIPLPSISLVDSPKAPIVFTTNLANLIRYPIILTHMMIHELIHYAGFIDPLYTGVDHNILSSSNSTLANQISIYDKTYYEFRPNIATHLDKVPTPFQPILAEFFDKHIGGQNMSYPEKLAKLKTELLNDDVLWNTFENEATDLITMRIAIESRRNGAFGVV